MAFFVQNNRFGFGPFFSVTDEELIAKAKEKLAVQRRQRKDALLKAKPEKCGMAPGPDEETKLSTRRSLAAEREKVREIMEKIRPMVRKHSLSESL